MDFNTAPIRDFLWESYGIYITTEFLQSVQDCSEQEKNERFIDHALNNLLLVRVKRDPGFRLYARDKVDVDPDLQERVRHIVLSLFGKTSGLSYVDVEAPGPKGEAEIMIRAIEAGKNPIEEVINYSQDPSLMQQYNKDRRERERISKTNFLQACLDEAAGHMGNELEMIAIRQQMLDHGTGKYYGHTLATDDPLFPETGLIDNTHHVVSSFVFSNLKFRGRIYGDPYEDQGDSSLFECIVWQIPYEITLQKAIFGKSIHDYVDFKESMQNCRDFWKFGSDLATIAYNEWFLTLSRGDKVSILNDDYPFEIRDDLLEEMAKFDTDSLDCLYFRMNQLFYAAYYGHAAKIGEFVFKRQKKGKQKYNTASGIATCYRQFEDYKNALKWYIIAKKLTNKLDRGNSIYKDFVEQKNCAEMGYYVHDSEHFKKEISRIIHDSKKMPAEIRSSIIYNIAEACRRTGHYELEHHYLTEYIGLADPSDPQFTESLKTSLERNGLYIKLPPNDYTIIREYETKQVERIYQRQYMNSSLSFQYGEAMRWIDRQINLNPEASDYHEKAVLCRHRGEDEAAISLYIIAAEKATNKRLKSFSLISIALLEAKKNGNVNPEIQDMIASALSSLPDGDKNKSEPELSNVVETTVYEIVRWEDTHLKNEFLDALVSAYQKCGYTGNPLITIGSAFLTHSLCSEAREWYERALTSADLGPERAQIMLLIGSTIFAEGNCQAACEWAEHAIKEDPKCAQAFAGIAQCHIALMEYDLAAKAIRQAVTIDPDNEVYHKLETEIQSLASHIISLKRIESEEVRKIFRTGDWLLFSVFSAQERDEYDLGPVVIQYGKGVEKMLYEVILRPIREKIRGDTSYIMPDGGVKKELWFGSKSKNIKPLPPSLKSIVGKRERSLALGQWKDLMKDIAKVKTNLMASAFGKMLAENGFDKGKLNEIGRLCSDLSYERNGAAHMSFYTRDEVQDKRGEMVKIINDIIALVL